jgi:Na+-transporting NADH:ubiquinone oxidoreductase subunit NqrA
MNDSRKDSKLSNYLNTDIQISSHGEKRPMIPGDTYDVA